MYSFVFVIAVLSADIQTNVAEQRYQARRLTGGSGGIQVFVRNQLQDRQEAIELPSGATAEDLYQAAQAMGLVDVRVGDKLMWQGDGIIRNDAQMADLGIGPEAELTVIPDMYSPGLNIEFTSKGGQDVNVIGKIGFPTGKFRVARDFRKAYCQALDEYCTRITSIQKFWFKDCKVVFEGGFNNGTDINPYTQDFVGNQYILYSTLDGLDYAWLEWTITPIQ